MRFPLASVRVGLINEAQFRHRLSELGKTGSNPTGDKADHTLPILAATTNPICQSPLEFDSDGGREVYIVGTREELLDKLIEVIQWETDEELTRAAYLVRETERGKRQNGQQDGAPTRRHHPKFNSRHNTVPDRFWNRS
jgi:hypothetical protein